MHIPKQIKIGGAKYVVKILGEDDMAERAAGQISTERCLIKLLKGEPQFMNITFLHEIFHAMNMELEETTIEFLAQSMYQVIADNPKLFEGGANHAKTK